MQVVWDNLPLIWGGIRFTMALFAMIVVLGTAIGILGGIALLYGNWWAQSFFRIYVDVIRGTPLIVVIFVLFYGPVAYGINLSPFWSIAFALSIFAGAHMSEIVRGAVGTIPKGQTDAAKALGLTFWPRMFSVLLPQSLPIMIPPWTNLASDMFKGTSLAVLASQTDFLFALQKVAARTKEYIPLYLFGLVIYFVCSFAISRSGVWLGRRMRHAVGA